MSATTIANSLAHFRFWILDFGFPFVGRRLRLFWLLRRDLAQVMDFRLPDQDCENRNRKVLFNVLSSSIQNPKPVLSKAEGSKIQNSLSPTLHSLLLLRLFFSHIRLPIRLQRLAAQFVEELDDTLIAHEFFLFVVIVMHDLFQRPAYTL